MAVRERSVSSAAHAGEEQRKPLPRKKSSVYALMPDGQWLRLSGMFALTGSILVLSLLLCLFLDRGYTELRLYYTLVAGLGLLYRIHYYARKEWLLYFIDLCFVNSILLIWSLWACTEDRCSHDWLIALYIVAQGPVAGATFPLQSPLTFHHLEGFESFFLHASPMWVTYAVRWRWPSALGPMPPFMLIMRAALTKVYGPWFVSYAVFLLVQPLMPDKIAGYETLMDGFIFPSSTAQERLKGKRRGFGSYAPKVIGSLLGHATLSLSGMVAATLSYQYHEVQVVWIASVLTGCVCSGCWFYYNCAHSDAARPGMKVGFLRMIGAWVVLLPTYFVSAGYL